MSLFRFALLLSIGLVIAGCETKRSAVASTSAQQQAPAVSNPDAGQRRATNQIPDRPEKLKFPPLVFEPPAADSFRVPLKAGPVAYVAESRELPLVNIAVFVHTGDYAEPEEKIGLAGFTGNLLTRGGTASKTAEELEERLAFLAAQLNSGISGAQGSVGLNLLSKDLDEGLSILREVLTSPRFQEDKLALLRQQSLQSMQERNDDSSSIEDRESSYLAYGEDFWAARDATKATVESITRDDLKAFHQRWFYPSNFVLAVSGDFDRSAMVQKLEKLFGDWPFKGEGVASVPTNSHFAKPGTYIVDKDVNQGRVSMMLPGIRRDNPDYFPAVMMNQILGGGGFTSRLVNRIRSDEGLAYSAGSSFPGGVYYPLTFSAHFQSKSRTVPFAVSIVMDEIKRMTAEPVSEAELDNAKRYFIETFPRTFATKAQVVATFAQEELTGRYFKDPNFFKEYRDRIRSVSRDDILRVAKKYLVSDKMVVLIVGQKEQIMLGHPDHPVKLAELVPGGITDVPLRDPMTLKPLKP